MAKLKAPLFSFGASGKLADSLVYFSWKGINVVRQYVIPTNPDTTAQSDHRKLLTTMVKAVHTAQGLEAEALGSNDQVAYSALASAKGKIMTWFNMAVKLGIDCLVNEKGYTVYSGGSLQDVSKEDFRPVIYFTDDTVKKCGAGSFYLGSSKTNLIHSVVAQVAEGVLAGLPVGDGFDGLTADKKYYWQFRPKSDDPCAGADSGIYYGVAE